MDSVLFKKKIEIKNGDFSNISFHSLKTKNRKLGM